MLGVSSRALDGSSMGQQCEIVDDGVVVTLDRDATGAALDRGSLVIAIVTRDTRVADEQQPIAFVTTPLYVDVGSCELSATAKQTSKLSYGFVLNNIFIYVNCSLNETSLYAQSSIILFAIDSFVPAKFARSTVAPSSTASRNSLHRSSAACRRWSNRISPSTVLHRQTKSNTTTKARRQQRPPTTRHRFTNSYLSCARRRSGARHS